MSTHVSSRSLDTVEPRPSRVGVGLLTKSGFGTAILMAVLAAIDAVAGDSIDADTRFLIGSAVATIIATILARGYQAGKLIAAKHGIDLPDQPLR
jgi:hypothetical protein